MCSLSIETIKSSSGCSTDFKLQAVPPENVPEGGMESFLCNPPYTFYFFFQPTPLHFSIMYILMY